MRIKVESVKKASHPEEYGVYGCDRCTDIDYRKPHPVDIVTFDVVIGDNHYIVEQPSVWRSYYSWQMYRSEDEATHISDYDEFSRILEEVDFPDMPIDEHLSPRLKLVVFEAMVWYDKAPTQSEYSLHSLCNLADTFSFWHPRSMRR